MRARQDGRVRIVLLARMQKVRIFSRAPRKLRSGVCATRVNLITENQHYIRHCSHDAGIITERKPSSSLITGSEAHAVLAWSCGARLAGHEYATERHRFRADPFPRLEFFQKHRFACFPSTRWNFTPLTLRTRWPFASILASAYRWTMNPRRGGRAGALCKPVSRHHHSEQEPSDHLHRVLMYDTYSPLRRTAAWFRLAPASPGSQEVIPSNVHGDGFDSRPLFFISAGENFELGRDRPKERVTQDGLAPSMWTSQRFI